MPTLDQTMEQIAPAGHTASLAALVLAWCGVLGPVVTVLASLFTFFWVLICIWESETCKLWRSGTRHWKNNLVMKHRAKRLAKLRALALKTEARILAEEKLRVAKGEARDLVASAAVQAAQVVLQEPVTTAEKLIPPIS